MPYPPHPAGRRKFITSLLAAAMAAAAPAQGYDPLALPTTLDIQVMDLTVAMVSFQGALNNMARAAVVRQIALSKGKQQSKV